MVGLTAEANSLNSSLMNSQSTPCNCKLEPDQGFANTSPLRPCPQCGSSNLCRDGLRYLSDGNVPNAGYAGIVPIDFQKNRYKKKSKMVIKYANRL